MATGNLDPRLLDLDTRHHRLRLSDMRVSLSPGGPCILVAVYPEQLECRDHRSSVCLGGEPFFVCQRLPVRTNVPQFFTTMGYCVRRRVTIRRKLQKISKVYEPLGRGDVPDVRPGLTLNHSWLTGYPFASLG